MKAGRKETAPGGYGRQQTEMKHPEEWAPDLSPDRLSGQNIGAETKHRGVAASRTARDVKSAHAALRNLADDELEQIPILAEGTRLEQGATYIDINRARAAEFTATGGMVAESSTLHVPKDRVPYQIWNRLLAALSERAEGEPHRTPDQPSGGTTNTGQR
jgi:hypothetical protein